MLRDSTPNVSFIFGYIKYVQTSLYPLKVDVLISTRQLDDSSFTSPMIIIRPREENYKSFEFVITGVTINTEILLEIKDFLMKKHQYSGSFIDYYNSQMMSYGSYCGERGYYFFD